MEHAKAGFGKYNKFILGAALAASVYVVGCGGKNNQTGPTPIEIPSVNQSPPVAIPPEPIPTPPMPPRPTDTMPGTPLHAIGDILEPSNVSFAIPVHEKVAAKPGKIILAGDLVYPDGTLDLFRNNFGPMYANRRLDLIPAVGNHEYQRFANASGFASYFGLPLGQLYYRVNLPKVDVYVLDSVDRVERGTAQYIWFVQEVQKAREPCSIIVTHYPWKTSGQNRDGANLQAIIEVAVDAGIDAIVSAHNHHFEAFRPQLANGVPDDARGITQLVAGTGGHPTLYDFMFLEPHSIKRIKDHGVLDMSFDGDKWYHKFDGLNSKYPDAGAVATPCRVKRR